MSRGASTIPILETQRLRLRPHRPEDLDNCAALWADPIVIRYTTGRPFTREEVWARLLRYAGHWHWMGYGFWLIEDRASHTFIGEIGLGDFKRDIEPPLPPAPEAGWILSPAAHRKGYATEALSAVLTWQKERLTLKDTCAIIHPENAASIRVATKCGFEEKNRAVYKDQNVIVFIRQAQNV